MMATELELVVRIRAITGLTFPIKVGWLPSNVDEAIALRGVGGTGDELGFGVEGIQFENPTIHVEARGGPEDYAAPQAQLELIRHDLPKVQAATLSDGTESGYYHTIIPRQSPFLVRIDEKRRPILAIVFDAKKELSA